VQGASRHAAACSDAAADAAAAAAEPPPASLFALLKRGTEADAGAVAELLAARPAAAREKDAKGDLPLHAACASGA
jgi:hypothetical protein